MKVRRENPLFIRLYVIYVDRLLRGSRARCMHRVVPNVQRFSSKPAHKSIAASSRLELLRQGITIERKHRSSIGWYVD